MFYKTIHTAYGLARMAQAEAAGVPIVLAEVAVGDGNGNPVVPTESMTQLVRERFRAPVNRVYQDPANPLRFTAELVIPADVGGFTLREIGIFDTEGSLFVVGNLPDTYKPTGLDGAYADTIVRVEFFVANVDVVTLQIDPSVAVATHTWILNNITPGWLLPGGNTFQILRKRSNADGDVEWHDPDVANIFVDTIEETQTLAAGQTIVDLAVVNTLGLAVYIDGIRLRADQWTADPIDAAKLTLATAYPAGTKFVGAQNEPAGNLPEPLQRPKNLADILDKPLARQNIDVFSRAETRQMAPPGLVAFFARSAAPTGWLKANGAAISRTAYAELFAAIGTTFGPGDGTNTFNLPDMRGEFVRGWDDGRGIDAERALGSWQADEFKAHAHGTKFDNRNGIDGDAFYKGGRYWADGSAGFDTNPAGGAETRPRNRALLACIKW